MFIQLLGCFVCNTGKTPGSRQDQAGCPGFCRYYLSYPKPTLAFNNRFIFPGAPAPYF